MKLNFINFMVKLVFVFVKCVCQINLNIIARSRRCNADRQNTSEFIDTAL